MIDSYCVGACLQMWLHESCSNTGHVGGHLVSTHWLCSLAMTCLHHQKINWSVKHLFFFIFILLLFPLPEEPFPFHCTNSEWTELLCSEWVKNHVFPPSVNISQESAGLERGVGVGRCWSIAQWRISTQASPACPFVCQQSHACVFQEPVKIRGPLLKS